MKYTDNEMCVILLSSHIGVDKESDVKPFSLAEWTKFLAALIEAKLQPSIAYHMTDEDAKCLGYDHAFTERIKKLVDRGAAVSFELQEYEKKGIQVITEINKDYPIMLKRQLQKKKPPVLFYAGNLDLAKNVGIGVVGSRNISIKGVDFTKELVSKATGENLIVYSGGAKGVDTISETAALHAGGAVVSFLADSLVTKIKKPAVASNIASGKLLLLSDQKPDVGFSVGRAMNRNKFIYASGYGTFVIESDYNKGGTWAGATEAITNNWGKVFVWDNEMEGNKKLIEAGGIPFLLDDNQKIYEVITQNIPQNSSENGTETYEQMNLSAFLKQ